jgi:hypothetical protein
MLYATPTPLRGESVASWFQRICQRHDCSMGWLLKHLGIPIHFDLDLDLQERHLQNISATTGIGKGRSGQQLRTSGREERLKARLQNLKSLRYRWCAQCLFQDREPYFRLRWRFGPARCEIHDCLLTSACPHCGHAPQFQITWHFRALGMNHCQACKAWLAQEKGEVNIKDAEGSSWQIAYRRKLRAAFQARVSAICAHTPFEGGEPHDWLCHRPQTTSPLVADASQIFDRQEMDIPYRKWSARVPRGSGTRIVLAAALILLRRERHAWTRASGAASQGARDADA